MAESNLDRLGFSEEKIRAMEAVKDTESEKKEDTGFIAGMGLANAKRESK
jgi:hypothetical protein